MREKKVVKIDRFDNFDASNNKIATHNFYNYFPTYKLENSSGVVNATFPKNRTDKSEKEINVKGAGINVIKGISYFKQYSKDYNINVHRLLIYGDDNKVYINQMLDDIYDIFWLYRLEFNSAPIVLSFKKDDADAVVLASEDTMKIWLTDYSPYTIENVPIITSMCVNEGVLFCTIKDPAFKIWYATDLDVEKVGNISNISGYISLEDDLGDARKILTFNEEVYVFRDYGITKLNFIKNEVVANQVYLSTTKIYTNTVSVCGNNILFMTKDGLYSFNGVKVNKINVDLLNELSIDNVGAVASSLGEKYYMAFNLNFNDGKTILCEDKCINNVLLIFDVIDNSYQIIRGVDIKTFLPVKTEVFEKMLVLFNNGPVDKIGEIKNNSLFMEEPLPKFWESENLVDTTNMKLFTKLSVNADKNVKFRLIYDDNEINFTTYAEGVNDFVFKIMCKNIRLEISSLEESAKVNNVTLDYYEY